MKTLVGIFVGLITLISFTWVNTAQAIPAFARKYEKACSSCHSAWPLLNKAGRTFKEAGYRFPSEDQHSQKIGKDLYWGKNFPLSVVIKLRPYDKKDSDNDPRLRAVHEVEILIAGTIGKKWAGFVEYEGEDETVDIGGTAELPAFNLNFGGVMVTWNVSKALNVQFADAMALFADPYDSYYHRRLTRNRPDLVDNSFGGADNGGKLRSDRQSVSIYGRPMPKLFYNVGIGAVSDRHEKGAPETLFARVAFDVTPKIMVGLLYIDGTCEAAACTVDRDFNRTGIDVQAEVNNFRFNAAFLTTEDDDATATATLENEAMYVQAIYVIKEGKRPKWVPLLRYDSIEYNNGVDKRNAWTANVSYYIKENVRGYLEYYSESKDTGGTEDSRVTLQIEVGF